MEQNLEPMESEKKPSPRGLKRALYLLLIALILGGGAALLVPPARTLAQRNAAVAAARETERTREEAIERAKVIDANLPILRKEGEKLAAGFAAPMETEEADKLVTGLIKGQGLTPRTLELGTFEPAGLPNTEEPFQGRSLLSCRMTATMSGQMEALWNLLAAVEETPGLRIVECSSREVTKPVSADALAADPFGAQSETETVHTVTFELITYQRPFETETSGLPELQPEESPSQPEEGDSETAQQGQQSEPENSEEPDGGDSGTSSGNGRLPSANSDTLETGDDPNGPLWNRD